MPTPAAGRVAPRRPDRIEEYAIVNQQDQTSIRWGILGTGVIAGRFAEGLRYAPGAELVAVGSRQRQTAETFADRLGIPRRHGSYESLANDPDVDVVYVATPHPMHADATVLCLSNGKHVLCEKPFALNSNEADRMVAAARGHDRFLMEAMWMRFRPAMVKLRELLADGAIGEVRMISAELSWKATFNAENRLFAPALGGGALLDCGVYPISFAAMVMGQPARITGVPTLGETGVDEQAGIVLGNDQGQLAVIAISIQGNGPRTASILGTKGRIDVPTDWHRPEALVLYPDGGEPQHFDLPHEGIGYHFEAIEVMNCIRAGKVESNTLPLADTLAIQRTMDELRAQWGIKYPSETIANG